MDKESEVSDLHYSISAQWWAGDEDAATVGVRLLETLDRLSLLAPAWRNWELLDRPGAEEVLLADARSGMTEFVELNTYRDDYDEPDPDEGYTLVTWSQAIAGEPDPPRKTNLTINAGSRWRNNILFEVGAGYKTLPDFALITYPLYFGALEILASSWPCPWAYADVFVDDHSEAEVFDPATFKWVEDPHEPSPPFKNVWMAYLSAPLAAGLTPSPELISKPTPGGGLILSATQDRLDPTNPEHMRRSRMLQAIMHERVSDAPKQSGTLRSKFPARVGPY